ncbi:hypothetical protein L210DRAFT_3401674 [Boletus edulis BED1]|uniref:Uncharacterized protein n=1 Tax=Boletus edulis BED1 TaxID=1328754 RepID=A0AAD4GEP9_BOLED|nr:hypothetical protein L210DRAFT_3401674 [Boletus edulis BED1]
MSNVLYDSQFQPPQVYAEGTWLYGAIVTGIFYGIIVVLYVMCARSTWSRIRSKNDGSKKNWFFFVYVNLLFALSTLYVASNSQITQLGFINHRDYPGGPSAFEINTSSAPLNVAFVVLNWCADALMIWRCIVVYRDCKFHRIVVGLGGFMLLGSLVTGSLWVSITSQPSQSTTSWMSFDLLFPYLSISLTINILICILTVVRLLYHRARITKALGPGYGMLYASFASMIIESAAVFSISSVLYLVSYAVNSPLANAFVQTLGQAQVIAPLLIIHRVSEGKAWTSNMSARLTSSTTQVARTPINSQPAKPLNVRVEYGRQLDHEGSIPLESKDSVV